MSTEYTHIISSEEKTRKALSMDLLDLNITTAKLTPGFTIAAANLDEQQVKTLEAKGYNVEPNAPKP